jgi:hypothetical protein
MNSYKYSKYLCKVSAEIYLKLGKKNLWLSIGMENSKKKKSEVGIFYSSKYNTFLTEIYTVPSQSLYGYAHLISVF